MYSKWGVGAWTPSLLAVLYLLALGVAISHYYFYSYLEGRVVDELSPQLLQAQISFISTVFVILFRACLSGALAVSYTQHIWHVFRKKPHKIQTIDRMYNVLMSPFNLLSWHLIRYAGLQLIFAILCFTLPLAAVFPPGALRVTTVDRTTTEMIEVPTFNPTFQVPPEDQFGDARMNRMHLVKQAMFSVTEDGEFYRPLPVTVRPVKQSLLGGDFLTLPPPPGCGLNCSYAIEFPGPSFECTETANYTYGYPGSPWYLAEDNYKRQSLYGESGGNHYIRSYDIPRMNFLVTWRTSSKDMNQLYRTASCDLYHTTYKVNVTYRRGVQSLDVGLQKERLIDGKVLTHKMPFRVSNFKNKDVILGKWNLGQTNQSFATIFIDSQMRAIRDSVVMALEGSILENDPLVSTSSLILETKWQYDNRKEFEISPNANYSYTSPLAITAAGLESLLVNATLSTIVSSGSKTQVEATIISPVTIYTFTPNRNVLILPYSIALGLALVLILIGARALFLNGVPAETGGFLQAICTTSGSQTVASATGTACLGGMRNFKDGNVKDVKLIYGGLKSTEVDIYGNYRTDTHNQTDTGVIQAYDQGYDDRTAFFQMLRAGFGSPEEVTPLIKGAPYGG